MALVVVKPTRIDTAIANEIAHHTNSGLELAAQAMTWGADEHVLFALAAAGWLYTWLGTRNSVPLQITSCWSRWQQPYCRMF